MVFFSQCLLQPSDGLTDVTEPHLEGLDRVKVELNRVLQEMFSAASEVDSLVEQQREEIVIVGDCTDHQLLLAHKDHSQILQ